MYSTLFAIFTAATITGLSATCYASAERGSPKPKVCGDFKVYTAEDGEKAAVCFDTKRPRLIQGAWTIVTFDGHKVLVEASK